MSPCGSAQRIIPINKTYNVSQHASWSATIMLINIANQFNVLRMRQAVNTNAEITRKEFFFTIFIMLGQTWRPFVVNEYRFRKNF